MKKLLIAVLASLIMLSCSDNKNAERKHYSVSQVDALIRDLSKEKSFSIILNDMDYDGDTYKHRYRVILQKKGTPKDSLLDWKPVTAKFFEDHENDMGMEIASKDSASGKVTKKAVPPGYNNYVGNSHYGQWSTGSDGQSFWQFYGQYMFMQSALGLTSPVYRTEYHTYTTEYRNSDRSYYGTSNKGQSHYGTNSYTASPQKNSFKQKMNGFKRSDGSKATPGSDRRNRYNESSSNTSNSSRYSYTPAPSTKSTPNVAKTTTTNTNNSYTYGSSRSNYQSNSLRNNSTSRSVSPPKSSSSSSKSSWWGSSSKSSSSSRSSGFGSSSKRRR